MLEFTFMRRRRTSALRQASFAFFMLADIEIIAPTALISDDRFLRGNWSNFAKRGGFEEMMP